MISDCSNQNTAIVNTAQLTWYKVIKIRGDLQQTRCLPELSDYVQSAAPPKIKRQKPASFPKTSAFCLFHNHFFCSSPLLWGHRWLFSFVPAPLCDTWWFPSAKRQQKRTRVASYVLFKVSAQTRLGVMPSSVSSALKKTCPCWTTSDNTTSVIQGINRPQNKRHYTKVPS